MEAFGKVHPSHRSYHQWVQMEEKERRKHDQRAGNIRRQISKLEDQIKRLSASSLADPEVTGREVRAMEEEIRKLKNESRAMEPTDEGGMQ